MPKRQRVRLTRRKKSSFNKRGGDPHAPDEDTWEQMNNFKKVVVCNESGEAVEFNLGDDALVLPHRIAIRSLNDYWIAKIMKIRSHQDNPSNVWLLVRWYYSSRDLTKEMEKSNPIIGKYERVLSNHYDLIHCTTLEGVTSVKEVNEDSSLNDIADGEFYCRFSVDVDSESPNLERLNRKS